MVYNLIGALLKVNLSTPELKMNSTNQATERVQARALTRQQGNVRSPGGLQGRARGGGRTAPLSPA